MYIFWVEIKVILGNWYVVCFLWLSLFNFLLRKFVSVKVILLFFVLWLEWV